LLELHGPDTDARGRDEPGGFVVLRGSTGRADTVPSIHAYLLERRQQLISQAVLEPVNGRLQVTADYRFDSPSTAAGVLLGRAANGRTEWKDSQGRTLKELQARASQA
jgi:hypothetical protein